MTIESASMIPTPNEGAPSTPATEPTTPAATEPATPAALDPSSTGEPSWRDTLPEDIKHDPSLKVFSDTAGLAKSYVHAQKMLGKDKIEIPDKYATPAQQKAMFQKLGLPETADKYDVTLKEGAKVNEDFFKGFKETAYNNNILPAQAQKMLDWYESSAAELNTKAEAKAQNDHNVEIEALKTEWGDAFKGKLSAAQVALKQFAGEKEMKYLAETGLAEDPNLIRLFANIGASLNEDSFKGDTISNLGITPEDAKRKRASIMGDSKHAYHDKNHPEHEMAVKEMAGFFAMS